MGIFDVPAPLLAWIDGHLAALPGVLRLALWGVAGGAVSMWLFRLISPQDRIARGKREQRDARARLDAFDGDFAAAGPLIRDLLRVSVAQVGRVTGPAIAASLPVLCLLVWVSTAYGHGFPESEAPAVRVVPEELEARWVRSIDGTPGILVTDGGEVPVASVPLTAPVPVVEKRHWWNVLVGNPAGYLAPRGPVERLEVTLPRREYLGVGPAWMRGWEFTFFAAVIAASVALKFLLRIE